LWVGDVRVWACSGFKICSWGSHRVCGILPARPSSNPHYGALVSLISQCLGFWGRGRGIGRGAESPQAMVSTVEK
jgi:hypothetical protein